MKRPEPLYSDQKEIIAWVSEKEVLTIEDCNADSADEINEFINWLIEVRLYFRFLEGKKR
jgi:hypothetical protein